MLVSARVLEGSTSSPVSYWKLNPSRSRPDPCPAYRDILLYVKSQTGSMLKAQVKTIKRCRDIRDHLRQGSSAHNLLNSLPIIQLIQTTLLHVNSGLELRSSVDGVGAKFLLDTKDLVELGETLRTCRCTGFLHVSQQRVSRQSYR